MLLSQNLMNKKTNLTVSIPRDMRFDLKMKALKNKTTVSNIVKKYLDAYISNSIELKPIELQTPSSDITFLNVIIPEDIRYKLKEKAAQDRTNIKTIILNFLTDYLQEKDEKQAALSELEQTYADKQLKLFEA